MESRNPKVKASVKTMANYNMILTEAIVQLLEEKGLLINRAGNVGDAVLGRLVDLDIIDFVPTQSGRARHCRPAP